MQAFGAAPNTFVVVGCDGSYYKCSFDPVQGGGATQLIYSHFMKESAEEAE